MKRMVGIYDDKVQFLSPDEEDRAFISQAIEKIKDGRFTEEHVRTRNGEDFPFGYSR